MPWGLTRFHHSGQSHFVTFCCYHRRRLLTADASRRIFESALERVRRSFRLQVYGYVVMPEHVHLLLSEPQWDISSDGTGGGWPIFDFFRLALPQLRLPHLSRFRKVRAPSADSWRLSFVLL